MPKIHMTKGLAAWTTAVVGTLGSGAGAYSIVGNPWAADEVAAVAPADASGGLQPQAGKPAQPVPIPDEAGQPQLGSAAGLPASPAPPAAGPRCSWTPPSPPLRTPRAPPIRRQAEVTARTRKQFVRRPTPTSQRRLRHSTGRPAKLPPSPDCPNSNRLREQACRPRGPRTRPKIPHPQRGGRRSPSHRRRWKNRRPIRSRAVRDPRSPWAGRCVKPLNPPSRTWNPKRRPGAVCTPTPPLARAPAINGARPRNRPPARPRQRTAAPRRCRCRFSHGPRAKLP